MRCFAIERQEIVRFTFLWVKHSWHPGDTGGRIGRLFFSLYRLQPFQLFLDRKSDR